MPRHSNRVARPLAVSEPPLRDQLGLRAPAVGIGVLVAGLIAWGGLGCGDAPAGLSSIRLTLGSERCQDWCVDSGSVEFFREDESFPIGMRQISDCDEAVTIEGLPAGHRIRLHVKLWSAAEEAADGGEPVLVGDSGLVTVVAGEVVEVVVLLEPMARPEVTAVSPDPVVGGGGGVTLTITGGGLAPAEGAHGVSLGWADRWAGGAGDGAPADDAVALTTDGWADGEVNATLPGDVHGSALWVRRCGVSSEPFPLRIVAEGAPGREEIAQPPGCAGRAAVALDRAYDGSLWAATRCDDPAGGYLQHIEAADESCALADGDAWALGGEPRDVALVGEVAWVALADSPTIAKVDLLDGQRSDLGGLPAQSRARRVVGAPAGPIFAIVADAEGVTSLVEAAATADAVTQVADVGPDLSLEELAIGASYLYATAQTPSGGGKLVGVPLDGGLVVEWNLGGCAAPGALVAGSGGRVAIACGDAIVAFDAESQTFSQIVLPEGAAASAIELDGRGDVALVVDPGGGRLHLVTVDPARAALLTSWEAPWAAGTAALRRHGERHEFVAALGGVLEVWTPYDRAGDCGGASP